MKVYKIGSKPVPDWIESLVNSGNVVFKTDGWCVVGNKFTKYSAHAGSYIVVDDNGNCRTSLPERVEKEVKQ